MPNIVLYGPVAWAPMLQELTGIPVRGVPVALLGYRLLSRSGACFPKLQKGEGSVPAQLFQDLPPAALERIGYFAAGLDAVAETCEVLADGQPQKATLYAPRSDAAAGQSDWQSGDWIREWGQVAINTVGEVLQHYGVVSPDRLATMMPMIMVRAAARVAASQAVPAEIRCDLPASEVDQQEQHIRHAGFFLTREYTLRHPQFGGGMSPAVRREVFVATDAAIVLPYDPVRDRVLLVEQFRMGPYGRGDPLPWMLEPVAGRIDPGETPIETARRECEEEAGLKLSRLEHISSHYCSPGCSTEFFHCYIGLCDLPDLSTGEGGLDSEDEDIRTHVLPFERAMALVPSGEAANGPLVLCLMWLQRERERLRSGA